ncbi:hypothetical protein PA598K_01981 [Paenibacillus sp. 598K]|uniref:copper amine oxidase N-terminal domain-containing protein n=1 Tax=Paenibacillus sp. 598K TaxID=1117987 RepID=UPI000FFA15D1|nr:copper amine oxidase N-terminal domain-containing protein [Paenibacillus sp. 598K]GBF73673.1 hypothetical protein PA598K_01981 [Paenibacillus sp. 598K]
MKARRISVLFAVVCCLAFGYTVHADSLPHLYEDVTAADLKNSIILSPESSIGFVDGQQVSAVQPIVQDGRTFVPLRFVSEGLGAKVDFNSSNQSINIAYNGKTVSLKLGSKSISIDGQSKNMDVVPRIQNHVTYIPLRDIGEALNKKAIYLQKEDSQANSFIILRGGDATAIENLNLIRVLDLLYQGKAVVYSDRYLAVIKENSKLLVTHLSPSFDISFRPFAYEEYIPTQYESKIGDLWFKTETSQFYLDHAWDTTKDFMLYRVDGDAISRIGIEKAPIKSVKTYQDEVFYLTQYMYGIADPDQTSNLKKAALIEGKWSVTYLGEPGYYYGYDIMGKAFDWSIGANGITTLGWYRYGDLTKEERLKTLGQYQIELTGHHHEFIQ